MQENDSHFKKISLMPFKTSCLLDSLESPKPTILFSYTAILDNCQLYIASRYCVAFRAVIKGRELGIFPHHYECDFHLLLYENGTKIKSKQNPQLFDSPPTCVICPETRNFNDSPKPFLYLSKPDVTNFLVKILFCNNL